MPFLLAAAVLAGSPPTNLPIIDVGPLLQADASPAARQGAIDSIGRACIDHGFFFVTNHGVEEALERRLETAAACFFEQPRAVKRRIEMKRAGRRWRGYFEVGEEFTSGLVDQKEGLYFAAELPEADERPLHGPNLFPDEAVAPGLRAAVLEYMAAMSALSSVLLRAIAAALGLAADHFGAQFAAPTTLFRIFHYPPHDPRWGAASEAVGEHTDYGYLTVLKQDDTGGLQVKCEATGDWVEAPPVPGSFVVNLGDALEHNTGGLLRATPHRVRQRAGAASGRFSFPFFFDPSFDARMSSVAHLLPPALRARAEARRAHAPARWDGRRVELFEGTYGDYLISKVSAVFPELSKEAL